MSSYVRMVLNPILQTVASDRNVRAATLAKALAALREEANLKRAEKVVKFGFNQAALTGSNGRNPVKVPKELLGYLKYLLNRGQISTRVYLKASENLKGTGTYHRFQILMRQLIIGLAKPRDNVPAALLALAKSKTVKKIAKAGGKKMVKTGSALARKGIRNLEKKAMSKLGNPLKPGEGKKKCCPYCGSLQIIPLYKLGSKKVTKFICKRCNLWFTPAKVSTRSKFVKKFKAELIEVKIAKKNAPKTAKVTKAELKKYSTKPSEKKVSKKKIETKKKTKPSVKKKSKVSYKSMIPGISAKMLSASDSITIKKKFPKFKFLIRDNIVYRMKPGSNNYTKWLTVIQARKLANKLNKLSNPCATVAGNPPAKAPSKRTKGNFGAKFYERCTAIEFSDGKQIQRITIKNNTNLSIVGRSDGSVDIVGTGASSIPAMGMSIIAIEARKGKNSLWPGELFRHNFTSRPTMKKIASNKVKLVPRRKNGKVQRLHKVFKY